jgi:hypothetical protein
MHTKEIKLPNGTVAVVNYNSDWSGDATIRWTDNVSVDGYDRTAIVPATILKECAHEDAVLEIMTLLESVRAEPSRAERVQVTKVEIAAYELIAAYHVGARLDRCVTKLAEAVADRSPPAQSIANMLGELAYDETTVEECNILLKAESVLRAKAREEAEEMS